MVVLIRFFVVGFVFIFSSCVKDSFIEVSPSPSFFGEWVGDSVYYYDVLDDSLFLNNFLVYSVFSPPDTFNFYQNNQYGRVFYSFGKKGGGVVNDSGVFNVNGDSLFLNSSVFLNSSFFVDSLGFEKVVLSKTSQEGDSLSVFVYKKTVPFVSYSKDIFPIWENMCSNCHYKNSKYVSLIPLLKGYENLFFGFSVNGDYSDFPYYIDTLTPANSLLYLKVIGSAPGSIMPQPPYSPLPEYQRALILKWIEQGALFN